MERAEKCAANVRDQMKAKNSAGYKSNDLVVSAFQELTAELKNDQK
jgi:hypothetical protein